MATMNAAINAATVNQITNSPGFRGKNVTGITPITLPDGRRAYHVTYTENQTHGETGRTARNAAGNAAGKTASTIGKVALWTAKTAWKLMPGKKKFARAWSGWLSNTIWISAVVYVTWQIASRM